MKPFFEPHQGEKSDVLSCIDRVVIAGTLLEIGHAEAIAQRFASRGIRVYDYTESAQPVREELRRNMERVATEAGLEIEFIRRHVKCQGGCSMDHARTGGRQGGSLGRLLAALPPRSVPSVPPSTAPRE